jgi:hypothetical protein
VGSRAVLGEGKSMSREHDDALQGYTRSIMMQNRSNLIKLTHKRYFTNLFPSFSILLIYSAQGSLALGHPNG